MCGIAGIACAAGSDPGRDLERNRRELPAMLSALAHRGPDGSGEHHDATGRVALGHRRLAILDLSPAGAQPMASADGATVLTFNGEIYNYLEVRKELEQAGGVFRSGSDTEVLLRAVERWGMDGAIRRAVGMFAFALWDSRSGTLHLARD